MVEKNIKDERVSYLSTLKFDPALWNTIQAKWITNIRVVVMLILSIVVIGTFAFMMIPRRLNPEIKIAIVTVITTLPGAGPEDIEKLITIPLEDALQNVDGLDTMTSSSRESVSAITLQFRSNIPADKAKSDAQSLVDGVIGLPDDAQTPSVKKIDFEDAPIWTFAITTKEDTASLMRFSKLLKERIKDLSKVDRVILSGFDIQNIQVEINPVKAREYGINPALLARQVQLAYGSYPAGNVQTETSSFALSIDRAINTVDDIRDMRITVKGESVHLGDIATIREKGVANQAFTYFADSRTKSKQAVEFFVYKTSSSNIDASEKDVKVVVEKTIQEYKNKFDLVSITNNAEDIVTQFQDLFGEFQSTILLVFLLLLAFLGLRQAIISSLTVPLTFLSGFAIINALGMSLNFLTMFALLIALGLLIDDTIVTVAAMTRYYKTGKFTPQETGLLVWRDFIVPLWSTTITTIWAFVPLLIATGIIGEFIKSIPIVVTAVMISSTSIAVLITIPLMTIFLKPEFSRRVVIFFQIVSVVILFVIIIGISPKNIILPFIIIATLIALGIGYITRKSLYSETKKIIQQNLLVHKIFLLIQRIADEGIINIEALSHGYMRIIDRILKSRHNRWATLLAVIIFGVVAYILPMLGLVKSEFFPKSDENILYMSVTFSPGTNLKTTTNEMQSLINDVRKIDLVKFVIAEAGSEISSMGGRSGNTNSFLLTLHLPDKKERKVTSIELAERLRKKYEGYNRGKLSVRELSGGPPVGADLQIKLSGNDLQILNTYADKIVLFLNSQQGVTSPEKSIKPGTSKLVFVPDTDKLAETGITIDMISLWLRTYASGFTLDKVKFGTNDETEVLFRLNEYTQDPESLSQLTISDTAGNAHPLLSLGRLELQSNPTLITREKGKRTLSVTAGVTQGFSSTEKNKDLEKFANTLNLPEGYSWSTGGANEENQKSVQSILQAMIISIILILVTMVIEFKSFRQTLIALLIIPLGISGVFYIFALTNTALSFPALIGVLALFGIVVTHAIVVIEKINDNRAHGMNLHDSIVDASGNRLEPVLLTSLATIVGLVPITIADPFWRGLGGAIIAGLLFSGAIKLFFVPVLYFMWFNHDEIKKK
ncbi:MAG: efflux RND transporter permease subunit [Candidatus Roizmanbacteria bacterium]